MPRSLVRLLGGFALALVVIVRSHRDAAARPRDTGRSSAPTSRSTPERRRRTWSGLTQVLAWKPGPEEVDLAELRALWERRIDHPSRAGRRPAAARVRRGRAARARRRRRRVVALAAPLLFVALTAAGYYWAFLPVVALAFRDQPRKVALLFGVEAASYGILLFDERDGAWSTSVTAWSAAASRAELCAIAGVLVAA